jgi:hypothetical protein
MSAATPPQPEALIRRMAISIVKRLEQSEFWAHALAATVSLQPEATPVQRLDRKDELYYIVRVAHQRGTTARLALSESTGHLLEAEGIAKPGEVLWPYCDPMAVMAARHRATDSPSAMRTALIGRHPTLVWRPCRESTSRLLPFWLLTVRDSLVYVRVDGQVFTRLTTSGRG